MTVLLMLGIQARSILETITNNIEVVDAKHDFSILGYSEVNGQESANKNDILINTVAYFLHHKMH